TYPHPAPCAVCNGLLVSITDTEVQSVPERRIIRCAFFIAQNKQAGHDPAALSGTPRNRPEEFWGHDASEYEGQGAELGRESDRRRHSSGCGDVWLEVDQPLHLERAESRRCHWYRHQHLRAGAGRVPAASSVESAVAAVG